MIGAGACGGSPLFGWIREAPKAQVRRETGKSAMSERQRERSIWLRLDRSREFGKYVTTVLDAEHALLRLLHEGCTCHKTWARALGRLVALRRACDLYENQYSLPHLLPGGEEFTRRDAYLKTRDWFLTQVPSSLMVTNVGANMTIDWTEGRFAFLGPMSQVIRRPERSIAVEGAS